MVGGVVEVPPLIWFVQIGSHARSGHDLVVTGMSGCHSNWLLMDTKLPTIMWMNFLISEPI